MEDNSFTEVIKLDPKLADFTKRLNDDRQKMETLAGWHMSLYEATKDSETPISLPWNADDTFLNANVYDYDSETYKSELNLEKSLAAIALVAKFASNQPNVQVTKKYDDRDFELHISVPSLDETTTYDLNYFCKREAVCTKRVVGTKEVPEQVIPARTEEVVEWDCTPVSLIKIADHNK